ncbi:cilia- and flagella-associated protein 299-like [Toxorhynchites rutilus septentrionalis]|uniref:cilia- and flagella-associated protein 299-like n=1 Tax=Toxorhynchites rutilus septentrionalis TaxID=329112 RepID=UPI0024799BE6|nr:cilia- and flagella-associated protein 299-like [Toxorhynchites rutilus septentrionalis]
MQITEKDLNFLKFPTHKEYLESLVTTLDLRYLGRNALRVYQNGFRSLAKTDFERRRNEIESFLCSNQYSNVLYSRGLQISDNFLGELAVRERPNRLGLLSTIIYMRYVLKHEEISGYIDYEEALRRTNIGKNSLDWKAIFRGDQVLYPTKLDLSFYNFKTDEVFNTRSANYHVLYDPIRGVIFRNIHDRKDIYPNPIENDVGPNTTRMEIDSDIYEQIMLYDHVIRKNY